MESASSKSFAVGKAEFGQDGVHLGVVLPLVAQHVHHLADGAFAPFFPRDDFHDGFLPVLRSVELVFWNEYVAVHHPVVQDEEGIARCHVEHAHERVARALEYFHHFPFGFLSLAACVEVHLGAVAAQAVAGLAFGDEDGFAAIVGAQVHLHAVAFDGAFRVSAPRVEFVFAPPFADDEVLVAQFKHDVAHEQALRLGLDAQQGRHLLIVERLVVVVAECIDDALGQFLPARAPGLPAVSLS